MHSENAVVSDVHWFIPQLLVGAVLAHLLADWAREVHEALRELLVGHGVEAAAAWRATGRAAR